jgi:hypothetical protein
MKIALFKDPRWDFTMPREFKDADHTSMVRVTDWVEVEFIERTAEELVPEQVALIDKQIAEATEKFGRMMMDLKTQKANLLALTDQREVA